MAAKTFRPWVIGATGDTVAWLTTCLQNTTVRQIQRTADVPAEPARDDVFFLDLTTVAEEQIEPALQMARQHAPHLPLIALVSGSEVGERALDAGADDFLISQEGGSSLVSRAVRYAQERHQFREQSRLRLYLENAPDVMFVLDLHDQRITYINRPHLFGYRAEALAQPGAILSLIHSSDHPAVLRHWQQVAAAQSGDVFVFEYRLRPKDGDSEWVQSRETVLKNGDSSRAPQMLVSLSVITNRREREAAVRRYAERLQILHEIDQAIVAARSPQAIAQATLRHISRLVSCRRASVAIFNWDQETFTIIAELPEGSMGNAESSSLPLDWFWDLTVLRQGELYRIDDVTPLLPESDKNLLSWWHKQGVRSLISVPLLAQKKLIGVLNFGGETPDSFSSEDVVVMREVAHVLAISINQARLYKQAHYHARKLEQRAKRLLLVNDISLAVNRPVNLNAVLEAAARGLVQVIDLRQVGIVLLNETRDTWTHLVSYSARRGGSSQELTILVQEKDQVQQLLQNNNLVVLDDAERELRLAGLEELLLEHHRDRLMIVPLQVRDEVIGVIGSDIGPGARPFSREETDLVQTIANLLSVKIEHIRLLEAEREARSEAEAHAASLKVRERHLTLLNSVTRATTGLEVNEMLQTVVKRLGESSGAHGCYITLWDEAKQRVIPAAAYGVRSDSYTSYNILPGEKTLTHTALEAGRPVKTGGNGDSRHVSQRIQEHFGKGSALAIPLLAGKERLGALIISHEHAYAFSESDVSLYEQASSQIALALSAARLFEETRRQLEELKVLHSLATAGAEAESEDALLERATQLMKESLFPDNFGVLLYDEEEQSLHRHYTYHSGQHEARTVRVPLGTGICGNVAQTGEAIRLGDVRQDERYVEVDPLTRSELCVPLKTGANLIGVVNVESRELNAYSEVHERLLSTFAHQLATAIEKLRLFARTQANLSETRALYQVSRSLIAAKNLPDLLQAVVNSVSQALPADRTILVTVDLQRRQIVDYVYDDLGDLPVPRVGFDALWQGLSGWVLREQQPLLSPKGRVDERGGDDMHKRRQAMGAGAIIVAPLRYRDETLGTITAINDRDGPDFTQDNVDLMVTMANQAAVAIENARLFAETRRRAEELEVLGNLSASLRVANSTEEITESLLTATVELFEADVVSVMVPGEESETLVLAHSYGMPQSLQALAYDLDSSIAGHVFTSGEPYRSDNILEDPRANLVKKETWRRETRQVKTAIYAPLQAGTQTTGVVSVINRPDHPLDEDDLGLLMAMAEIAGSALHRAGLMETLEQRVVERTRELAEANERLKELDRLKSKFVSDVSHELRTPITSLSLYLDLIERGSPERSERYWAVLRKQTERLNQLIEDILSLSRLQMGKVDATLMPVDLNELVQEMVEVRREDFIATGLSLEFEGDETLPPVSAQPELLSQVVDNLLSNAFNYTDDGVVHVRVFHDSSGESACLSIRDSGAGIEPDDLPHIFERFYRGQFAAQSNIPGTGLGLTIVEEIVNLHQGQIDVSSELGKGTTFRVSLPLNKPESPDPPRAPSD